MTKLQSFETKITLWRHQIWLKYVGKKNKTMLFLVLRQPPFLSVRA